MLEDAEVSASSASAVGIPLLSSCSRVYSSLLLLLAWAYYVSLYQNTMLFTTDIGYDAGCLAALVVIRGCLVSNYGGICASLEGSLRGVPSCAAEVFLGRGFRKKWGPNMSCGAAFRSEKLLGVGGWRPRPKPLYTSTKPKIVIYFSTLALYFH